jgi:hypothetical protein
MLRGGRAGKFDKTNPQFETVVSSFANICNALNAAPDQWWKEPSPEEAHILQAGDNDEQYSFVMPRDDDDDDDDDNDARDEEEKNENADAPQEDELMEFQANDAVQEEVMEYRADDVDMHEEDDDATELFASPGSLPSKRSCSLPSQSPDCSAIAPTMSQLTVIEEDMVDAVKKAVVKKSPKIAKLANEKVRVVIASDLSTDDRKVLDTLEKEGAIEIFKTVVDERVICVCGNAELETGDGWLVGLTFPYLWAMARGAEIMYASYFHKHPFREIDDKNRVIGVGSSTDWMGPQRAVKARKEGEFLLEGYTLIIVGDFDALPQSRRGDKAESHTIFSKGRIQTLLSLCGAKILSMADLQDPEEVAMIDQNDKIAFLIRPNPHARYWRAARKEVSGTTMEGKPIVCANWLLESLADYRCNDLDLYTQTHFK